MVDKPKIPGIEDIVKAFDLDRSDPNFNAFLAALITREMEREREYKKIEHRARVDGKTGLERFEELFPALEREYARANRHDENLSILMLDVDNFKKYNRYGYLQGDEALGVVGKVVKSSVRKEDIAVRFGGEEVCIILPETDEAGAKAGAESIRKNIEKTEIPKATKEVQIDEGYKHVTVTIGGFTYNPKLDAVLGFLDDNMSDRDRIMLLIEKANSALRTGKDTKKNSYYVTKIE